jgi:hypothetical protein
MVTAILPSLTDEGTSSSEIIGPRKPTHAARDSVAHSLDSELTITPERFRGQAENSTANGDARAAETGKTSALAGYVGLFTGCGALVALSLFLPLPARFGQMEGVSPGQAVSYSFYVVGVVSLAVAIFVSIGLRKLRGEEGKGWRLLLGLKKPGQPGSARTESAGPTKV